MNLQPGSFKTEAKQLAKSAGYCFLNCATEDLQNWAVETGETLSGGLRLFALGLGGRPRKNGGLALAKAVMGKAWPTIKPPESPSEQQTVTELQTTASTAVLDEEDVVTPSCLFQTSKPTTLSPTLRPTLADEDDPLTPVHRKECLSMVALMTLHHTRYGLCRSGTLLGHGYRADLQRSLKRQWNM